MDPRPHEVTILQNVRVKRGLTQTALAKQTGISRNIICYIESGRVNPTDDELEKLAQALGVPANRLLRVVEPDLAEQPQ